MIEYDSYISVLQPGMKYESIGTSARYQFAYRNAYIGRALERENHTVFIVSILYIAIHRHHKFFLTDVVLKSNH